MHGTGLADLLNQELGGAWRLRPLGASGFCDTWRAESAAGQLFVKSAAGPSGAMLEAEADGLRALAASGTIRVPSVACLCTGAGTTLLAMEWLDLRPADAGFGARFGEALGTLHAQPCPLQPARYGWTRDNFIGATPQANALSQGDRLGDWIAFLGTQRLGAMRDRLAARDGGGKELPDAIDAVIAALSRFFDDGHLPRPSLIHGDLWQGNWGMLAGGAPVVYDPALSCGDAEADLAMMELFGAPPAGFWPAYRAAAGLHAGYARRRPLYQLYHLLNHALLFGGGYAAQSLRRARALLAGA